MIRLALRRLGNRRGFAAVAIATLALGIGAPTAIFSVVRAGLIQPLPYPEPDRLVRFRLEGRSPRGAVSFDAVPAQAALAWAQETSTLAGLALYNDRALTLSTSEGPFRLTGQSATPNLFEILGVAPAYGRTFRADATDAREIVFSHATWSRYFSSDPAILNSTVTLDATAYRVVGVMPETFGFPSPEVAFWVPLILDAGSTRGMVLPAVARMKPEATLAGVIQEGRARLGDEGDPRFQHTLNGDTLKNQMVGGARRPLWVLLGAVGFVLAIATANIALLLLVRGAARAREFSIQLSLGANRGVLRRQLLVESLTLGAIGGAAGLLLAWLGLDLLLTLAPPEMPRLQRASIDGPVVAVAAILTMATSAIFGALSAGRTLMTSAAAPLRLRLNILATCVLAFTIVLLVGAGLLLRSFLGLVLIDPGFDTRGALALQINLPDARYPGAAARLTFLERLREELGSVAGVDTIGLATTLPNRQPTGRFILS